MPRIVSFRLRLNNATARMGVESTRLSRSLLRQRWVLSTFPEFRKRGSWSTRSEGGRCGPMVEYNSFPASSERLEALLHLLGRDLLSVQRCPLSKVFCAFERANDHRIEAGISY